MKILICNAGSTSLKFKLYDMPAEEVLASGGVERVGSTDDAIYKYDNASRGVSLREEKQSVPDYETGIRRFLSDLTDAERGTIGSVADIDRVGFKTVLSRGYYGVHELTEPVLQGMRDMYAAAPAHNGPYLAAIEALRAVLPEAMFVGAFETDFHRTIPLDRCVYGVPYEWMEKYGVRRMGYHGASSVPSGSGAVFGAGFAAFAHGIPRRISLVCGVAAQRVGRKKVPRYFVPSRRQRLDLRHRKRREP